MKHSKTKVLIVYSEFNQAITSSLRDGAKNYFLEEGVEEENLTILKVPGAVEIPIALKREIERAKQVGRDYDVAVAIGSVVRGSTPHFEYVCNLVSDGVREVMLEVNVPISFGILTTDNFEQAIKRCAYDHSNKGCEAASAVLQTFEDLEALAKN